MSTTLTPAMILTADALLDLGHRSPASSCAMTRTGRLQRWSSVRPQLRMPPLWRTRTSSSLCAQQQQPSTMRQQRDRRICKPASMPCSSDMTHGVHGIAII